uniref:Uncharacterized protein n=1 Tax=Pipistrellus kuhlii TaxID=59472 RepID=A0A7J8B193_PIPKU|nr:hypothetical protein mPipKuh1_007649 [Pipistrellus kuhlii]
MLPVPTHKHPEHVMGAPGMNGRGSPALVRLNKLSLLNCAQALSARWKGTKPSHTDSFPPLRPEMQLCRVLCGKKTERCRQPCRADTRSCLTEHPLPWPGAASQKGKSGSKHVLKAGAQIDWPSNQFTGNSVLFPVCFCIHCLYLKKKNVEF